MLPKSTWITKTGKTDKTRKRENQIVIQNGQHRDETGNKGNKTQNEDKAKNTIQTSKKISNTDPTKVKRVWRYQSGNQNPYIAEEQTTQWSKEKVQMDKQRSTKHTYKTKDRVTRTPLKTGGELVPVFYTTPDILLVNSYKRFVDDRGENAFT